MSHSEPKTKKKTKQREKKAKLLKFRDASKYVDIYICQQWCGLRDVCSCPGLVNFRTGAGALFFLRLLSDAKPPLHRSPKTHTFAPITGGKV